MRYLSVIAFTLGHQQQNLRFYKKKSLILFFNSQNLCIFATAKRKEPIIGLWCNGNTTDSGPVIPGSNPGSPTCL